MTEEEKAEQLTKIGQLLSFHGCVAGDTVLDTVTLLLNQHRDLNRQLRDTGLILRGLPTDRELAEPTRDTVDLARTIMAEGRELAQKANVYNATVKLVGGMAQERPGNLYGTVSNLVRDLAAEQRTTNGLRDRAVRAERATDMMRVERDHAVAEAVGLREDAIRLAGRRPTTRTFDNDGTLTINTDDTFIVIVKKEKS